MIQEKICALRTEWEAINEQLTTPDIVQERERYRTLTRKQKRLGTILRVHDAWRAVEVSIAQTQAFVEAEENQELRQLGRAELGELEQQERRLAAELHELLVPRDPRDEKDVVLELRAGTGGDEAAIWVGDLFRMYSRMAERKGWRFEVIDYTEGTAGGYKELIAAVRGEAVYGELKYESGVHRVQRVPATETQGRIHTSAASVVVLPEADEVDVKIDMNEIRKDTFCSSGPGGQSVNTTYSAVRLTHLPTGMVVSCQNNKSQIRNLEEALHVLRARLYERAMAERQREVGAERKSMIGSGDRSDKIRTYNYPQGRVTDHRIGLTQHRLEAILDGRIDEFTQQLKLADGGGRAE